MLIYYITFLGVLFFSLNAKHSTIRVNVGTGANEYNQLNVLLVFAIFAFFAGMRYQVGSDWWAYFSPLHADFERSLSLSILEPGWKLIGYFSTLIWNHRGVAMFVAAAITIWLYVWTYTKYTPDFVLSTILFFLLIWCGCFNGVRQYLAAAVLFAGHRYILKQDFLRWAIVVGIAMLFHTTAVIMLFPYFIVTRKLDFKQFLFLLFAAGILLGAYSWIYGFLGWYKDSLVDANGAYQSRGVNLFRLIVYWMPVIYYWAFLNPQQYKKFDPEINFYGNLILLSAILMTATCKSAYLARVGIFTQCFLIIAWPLMFRKIESKFRNATFLPVLVGYALYWAYDIYSHPDLRPFQLWLGK